MTGGAWFVLTVFVIAAGFDLWQARGLLRTLRTSPRFLWAASIALLLTSLGFIIAAGPAWLEAIGPVGAFGVGIYEIGRLARREAERDERAQADLVAGWYVGPDHAASAVGPTALVAVKNASQLPIFDVQWHLGEPSEGVAPDGWQISPALGVPVGPDKEQTIGTGVGLKHDDLGRIVAPGVGLTFRDAAGRWWVRHPGGQLEKLDGRPYYSI